MHLLALALLLPVVAAQDKPSDPASGPRRGDAVTVRGCISGGTIESSETEVRDSTGKYSGFVTYRLTGDKKTLKTIKQEHDGHLDTLTGVLKSDLPNANTPRSKRIGNTRITIGVGESPRTDPRAMEYMPALEVKEIEHSGTTCRK
jgi:hypothetical protein